jgi:peptidyl-tRNA hydrolase, PTH2 family
VLCFPLRRRSDADPELARLQAHTGGTLQRSGIADLSDETPVMVLLIANDLGLTLGKACAQVAHGALIGSELHQPAATTAWEGRGQRIAVVLVDDQTFQRAKSELIVAAVRDAGLTQIPAGTETVLATEPGADLPEWLRKAARTIV